MSDGGAQHIIFGPYFDSDGVLYPNIKVYHYAAGTTNNADMWSNESKADTVAQPFIGDTAGVARLFGDNIYKIVIHDENDNLIKDYTWDNVKISRDVEGVLRNGTSFPGVNANNTWQLAVKKDGSGNFSQLGISDGSSFIVLVEKNAGDTETTFGDVAADDITQNGNAVLDITDLLDEDDMVSDSDTKGVTQQSLVAYVGAYSNTGIRDIVRNLVIITNLSNPTYQIDIDADEVATQDGSGGFKILSSVNLTVDITVAGANGIDTGSEATDAWYYIWVIAKADGTTAGLLSTSSTAPTMPATYTFKALIGAVRNTSSDFLPFKQLDNKVTYNTLRLILDAATADAWTAKNITVFFPSTAKHITCNMGCQGKAGTGFYGGVGLSPRSDGRAGSYAFGGAEANGLTFGGIMSSSDFIAHHTIRYEDTIYYYSTVIDTDIYAIGWEY